MLVKRYIQLEGTSLYHDDQVPPVKHSNCSVEFRCSTNLGTEEIGTEYWIIACIRELHEFQGKFNIYMLQNRHPLDSVIMLLFMIAVKGSEIPLIISICMVIGIRCSSIRKVKVGDRTALKGGVSNKLYK